MSVEPPHIGMLREKPLHASLKRWYARPGDAIEVPVDSYVIDLVRGDLLVEIQTRGFSSMKKKVNELLARGHRIRIVHPIAVDRWIVKIDADGVEIDRRRSPRHGSPVDVVSELVSFPHLLADPGLEIEVVSTIEEEYRRHTPDGSWRRKGWSVVERRLVEVLDRTLITDAADLLALLPADLPGEFTTANLARALGRPRRIAQQMAYCLRKAGMVEAVDKQGNAVVYRTSPP